MRQLRPDVSHRMKRRPSIFTAPWFRAVLGVGVAIILGLLLGPPMASWLREPGRPTLPAIVSNPVVQPAPEEDRPEAAAAVRSEAPAPSAPTADGPAALADTAPQARPEAATDPAPATPKPEPSASTNQGPALFRIQVGAFLDHRNADRLVERLRSEGFEAANSIVEETRTLYRVLATPADGEGYPGLLQRLRELGFTSELTDHGAAVTRLVPLRSAVEASRRLREQGIRVRLEREVSSAAFRVVRVGSFPTAEEAEHGRAELLAKGYEGIVVRDR